MTAKRLKFLTSKEGREKMEALITEAIKGLRVEVVDYYDEDEDETKTAVFYSDPSVDDEDENTTTANP